MRKLGVTIRKTIDSVIATRCIESGYEFCLFDGLNRFYVASEHRELTPALSYPAGVFDQPYTVGNGEQGLAARTEALIVERDKFAAGYAHMQGEHERLRGGYDELHARYDLTVASYDELHTKYDTTVTAYSALEHEQQPAGRRFNCVVSWSQSTSFLFS